MIETQPNTDLELQTPTSEQLEPSPFAIDDIERIARDGLDTYKGKRHLEFRVGIEVEFGLHRPSKFRHDVVDNEEFSESFKKDNVGLVLNPDTIQAEDHEYIDLVGEFRDYAKGFLQRLEPSSEEEEGFRSLWIGQIDELGPAEIFNFLVYEEFSKPKLHIPETPEGDNLANIDAYSEENGWIEWRFGNGTLQSGYYDNDGTSEMRLTPCSPAEALRRTAIIKQRMAEIGTELGVIVTTGAQMEHVNLSVYEKQSDGTFKELIGNSESKAADTLDVTSGIMEANQDGIHIDAQMASRYDYIFSEHVGSKLRVGPTRRTLRVLDGRVELRGGFRNTEQATAWLLAGAVDGLTHGAEALASEGYEIARYGEVMRVERIEGFDKEADLQVQRMLENSELDEEGRLSLNDGYATVRGEAIAQCLLGEEAGENQAPNVLSSTVVTATRIDSNGLPSVTAASLTEAVYGLSERLRDKVLSYGFEDPDTLADRLNDRLAKVRVVKDRAIIGTSEHRGLGREGTIQRMAASRVIALALGDNLDDYINAVDKASKDSEEQQAA